MSRGLDCSLFDASCTKGCDSRNGRSSVATERATHPRPILVRDQVHVAHDLRIQERFLFDPVNGFEVYFFGRAGWASSKTEIGGAPSSFSSPQPMFARPSIERDAAAIVHCSAHLNE